MTTQECPKCGPVPDVELYGIEYPEVYDGVLFWAHGKCGTAWPRNADWEASVAAARAHNERSAR